MFYFRLTNIMFINNLQSLNLHKKSQLILINKPINICPYAAVGRGKQKMYRTDQKQLIPES